MFERFIAILFGLFALIAGAVSTGIGFGMLEMPAGVSRWLPLLAAIIVTALCIAISLLAASRGWGQVKETVVREGEVDNVVFLGKRQEVIYNQVWVRCATPLILIGAAFFGMLVFGVLFPEMAGAAFRQYGDLPGALLTLLLPLLFIGGLWWQYVRTSK